MKRLYEKGVKGIALILAGLLVFMSVFTGDILQAKADNDPQLTVSDSFSVTGDGSVYYLPADGGNIEDSDTWIPISDGISPAVSAIAIVFSGNNSYASGITFSDESFDDHDGSVFWLDPQHGEYNLVSVTFTEGDPPASNPTICDLTVSSYDGVHGYVNYIDANGDEQLADADGETVQAMAVSFGTYQNSGYHVSQVVYNGTTYTGNEITDDHFDFDTDGAKSIAVTFAEDQGNNDPQNPPIVITLKANPYSTTHGKIQYSLDESTWTDIPAGGIGEPGIDAGFVKAVPESGYNVSYRVDNTTYTDTDSHSLGEGVHWVSDVSFTSDTKSLTVASYDSTYGTIQYSVDGSTWSNVNGATVSAKYVKATPAANGMLDSYTINNVNVVSTASRQLNADSNITGVSFSASGGTGGKYTLSVTSSNDVNASVTVSFLNSSGEVISSATSATAQDIPDATAKIRITVTGDYQFMSRMQVIRKDASADSTDNNGTELSGGRALEQAIWDSGVAEFAASAGYSYKINMGFSKTKSVRWRYPSDRGTGDTQEDEIVEHARLYKLNATSDSNVNVNDRSEEKDQMLTIGTTYYFLLIPDYGYQVSSLQINGGPTMSPIAGDNNMGVFKFTMTNQNFHFKGIVSPARDIISTSGSTTVSNATLAGGSNATDSGNVRMTVTDTNLDADAVAVAGADATGVATVDIDLEKVVSKGGNNGYWSSPITTTRRDVTVGLAVSAAGLSAGETYSVVRNHNNTRTLLNATYNSTTGMLTFPSSEFSDYTIVKVPGNPETNNEIQEVTDDSTSFDGTSSGEGNSDDDDTPPSSGDNGGFLGVVNGTNTISSWNELDSFLKSGGDISALADASGNTGNSGSSGKKSTGKIVDLSLSGNNMSIPASIFASLSKSSVSGMHILTNNGIALTFGKSKNMTLQGPLDISAKVTKTANSTKIAFNKPQALFVPTALHTTVPKGTKTVKLFFVGPDGRKYFLGNLKPNADGQVMFLIGLLGTYELVY